MTPTSAPASPAPLLPLTLEEARHQINVQKKAEQLFERGYSGRWLTEDVLEVVSPSGGTYVLDLFSQSCQCPHFEDYGYCSHLWGWPRLMRGMAQEGACVHA
jgi:hypothetical protein